MRSILALALILLSVNQIYGHITHNCAHDTLEHNFVHHEVPVDEEPAKRSLAATTWLPLRITADYSGLTGLTAVQTNFLKNKLIPDVITFFNKALSIVRYNTAGTITLPAANCGGITIPTKYSVKSGFSTDFVLFVQATHPSGGSLAVAGACFLGNDKRPIAGRVNYNAASVNADPAAYASQLTLIQHEITHALGFSSSLFPSFKATPSTKAVNWRGTTGTIVSTPRVATTAKRHFGCSDLTGAEVENEGKAGSFGSHWERRVLGNEAMTASVSSDGRYSYFTLALLEDSGWYKANYAMAAPLDYGKGKGCNFIYQTCIDKVTKKARFPEFCTTPVSDCTPDGSAKGYCSISKASSTKYNYLGDHSTSTDIYNDECPTYRSYSNGRCSDTTLTPAFFLPEKYSATSKCFSGTLLDKRYVNDGSVRFGCYTAQCTVVNKVQKVSIVVGNIAYTCAKAGAQITNIPGYTGFITCPDANLYCAVRSTQIINPNNAA